MMTVRGPAPISVPAQLQVRMSDEPLRKLLEKSCNRTRLSPPEATRQLMWLALRNGVEVGAAGMGLQSGGDKPAATGIPTDRLFDLLIQALEENRFTITPPGKATRRKRTT